MDLSKVMVPGTLLTASNLSKSAKLVWIFLQLPTGQSGRRKRVGDVHALSGLARSTVRTALSELTQAGWLCRTSEQSSAPARVTIPIEVLLDKRLGTREKLLYALLQLTPSYHDGKGRFIYTDLSTLAGVSLSTVKRAVRTLKHTGWLQLTRSDKPGLLRFTLRNPETERHNRAVTKINRRLADKNQHKGETLMREYLNRIIDSNQYDDNARLGFLLNPYSGEEMELDRYYAAGVAFEFQGAQHFGPTERYPDEHDARKQRARDHMKAGMCKDQDIRLVLVHPEDLSLAALRQKVVAVAPDRLPLRALEGDDRLIAFLERVSKGYREKAGVA